MDDHKVLTDVYGALLAEGKYDKFREQYLTLHPYDQSQIYMQLNREERTIVSYYLSPEEMAEIMGNLLDETELLEDALSDMDPNYAASVITDMYTDDAVDLLENLEKEQTISYLMLMDKDRAEPIRHLLHYEDSTAGSIMTTEYIGVSENQTVRDAMQMLRKEALDAELIYYIYVVDHQNKLTGVISLRDLLVAADDTWIFELMNEQVHYAKVSDDQETVARMMRDYDFLALPVVDFQLHMVGIITVDDIMDVMDEIASDDYSKLAGVSEMEKLDTKSAFLCSKTIPWLIILLFLGLITANLISHFESALSQKAILAVFIPLIAGMAGNTGTQSLAVIVRGIATGEIAEENKWLLLLREAGTGLITGVTCGILVTILVFAWQDDFFLAILVGNSILVSLMVATLAGSLVPLVMNKLKIDPAVASGPFITTINDLISIVIYFGMATIFMNRLG